MMHATMPHDTHAAQYVWLVLVLVSCGLPVEGRQTAMVLGNGGGVAKGLARVAVTIGSTSSAANSTANSI